MKLKDSVAPVDLVNPIDVAAEPEKASDKCLLGSRWRVIGKEHLCYFTPGTLTRVIREAGFSNVRVTTRNIDPNEIKRAFSRETVEGGTGFQAATTEELRQQLETVPLLKLAKRAANSVLGTTGTGDTIAVRAEK
jgi:hypothetical protein